VLGSARDKAALYAATGALAADMESAAVMAAATAAGLAALVVRGVSDAAGDSVPPALASVLDVDGRVHAARFVALALSRPRLVSDALALQRGSRKALAAVARALGALRA